jgi:iron(III) transport system permease protein
MTLTTARSPQDPARRRRGTAATPKPSAEPGRGDGPQPGSPGGQRSGPAGQGPLTAGAGGRPGGGPGGWPPLGTGAGRGFGAGLGGLARSGRWPLLLLLLAVALLALVPILGLAPYALQGGLPTATAGNGAGEALAHTVALLLLVGLGSALLGTATGWLTAACAFPGRRLLRIAQLLPLAAPPYLLAATLIDSGSRVGLRFHGDLWAAAVLVLGTYSYVFLLATESFAAGGLRQIEACRSLGVGPWGGFRRVALPMAAPAIGAGVALAGMEVVNELGAVELLGVPTLSGTILQRWQSDADPRGAVALALITLVMVSLLVACERQLRRRSRRWLSGGDSQAASPWPLRGWRARLAQLITLVPPLLSLGLPLLWMLLSRDQLGSGDGADLLALGLRSLGLALAAALFTALAGLVLALGRRWFAAPWLGRLAFTAGMGYAVPGAVLALALLLLGAPLGLPPLLLLLWGYTDRFLAVSRQGLDAALERLPPSLDEAATGLGCGWWAVLRRVHLPLLRGPLLVGALLVFVDVVKELPLSFALRPFDCDTLSVRVYQYASDERLGAALIPAALILSLGLVASLALVPQLERRR